MPRNSAGESATQDRKPAAGDPAEAMRAELETLRADVARLTETLAAFGRSGAEALRHQAAGAQTAAGEKLDDLRARLADTQGAVQDYAREKPAHAMGIAAGLGLLLGLLLARR